MDNKKELKIGQKLWWGNLGGYVVYGGWVKNKLHFDSYLISDEEMIAMPSDYWVNIAIPVNCPTVANTRLDLSNLKLLNK